MNEPIIKEMINRAVDLKFQYDDLIEDIKTYISDEEVYSLVRKFLQRPNYVFNDWNLEIEDECFIKTEWYCSGDTDIHFIPIKYLLDNNLLDQYLKEQEELEKQKDEERRSNIEKQEKEVLARLKKKYNS